jgi:hypothetical protein
MRRYWATVVPENSLFLGRERGNRVVRRSFHYIPASTIGGALNTRFYQIGWEEDLAGRFRFGNLYPAASGEGEDMWIPAPHNLYYCPTCRTGHLVTDFQPEKALDALICPDCRAMRRRQRGVVQARMKGHGFEVFPDQRKASPPMVGALTVGRTELQRTSATHVDGRLHMVELLRARGIPFCGDVWVEDEAAKVVRPGVTFRLSIGGLRSRGSGRAELRIGDEITTTPASGAVLMAETPLLPLPEDVTGAFTLLTRIATPYVSVGVSERWAAKPLESGKGLISFLNTVARGSVFAALGNVALDEQMFFYRLDGSGLELHGFDWEACGKYIYHDDYSFTDLWTLGYGRLRWLR